MSFNAAVVDVFDVIVARNVRLVHKYYGGTMAGLLACNKPCPYVMREYIALKRTCSTLLLLYYV